MHPVCRPLVALVLLPGLAATATAQEKAEAVAPADLVGHWQGKLTVGAVELRLVLHFTLEDGKLKGTMDSPDQGAKGIAIGDIATKDRQVTLDWPALQAKFEGELSDDGKSLPGTWRQSGLKLPVTFGRLDKAPELVRPQEPKKPYPYDSEEVTFENEDAGIRFAGTLTLPRSEGPHPAAVLLSGSGSQDRDETLFGHNTFLVLADHLTRRGVAVLRFDDRGVGGSGGDPKTSTMEDHAGDALAALNYLKSRKEIDPGRIGFIGHSEGGLVGPLAASRSGDVAFVVMLAGTGLPGDEVLYRQGEALMKAMGQDDEKTLRRQRELQKTLFAIVRAEEDDAQAQERMEEAFGKLVASLSEEERKELESVNSLVKSQLKQLTTPWFRHFLAYDPRPTLQKVRCPVLAVIGGLDLQVPAAANLPEIEKALKAGGNKDYTVKALPKLNHLFQTATTGSTLEYGRIEETFAPAALDLIAGWVVDRTKR